MATRSQNIQRRVESANPMARFSIGEDDEEASLAHKRQRLLRRSQSQVVSEEDEDEEELIPVEDVESDSQGIEEDDDDEEEDDESEAEEEEEVREDVETAEPVSEGQNQQQQQITCSRASSLCRIYASLLNDERVSNNANEALQVVLTDPDVLDCPICLDPLCTPVFQCENGHIACSSCCSKVNRKCPSCCMPIGYNRCRAIEKVIESIKISCKNTRYGCKETMTYSKKNEHEQTCPHAACFCPNPSCPFAGSSKNLYLHFGIQHAASTTRFTYNTTFSIHVEMNQKHVFLQEQHESVIFILNQKVQELGRAFSVDCVGPISLKGSFGYQLTAKSMETSLSLQSVPEIYTKWSEHTLRRTYLTVPKDFSGYSGILSLHVCIKKVRSPV